MMPKWPKLASLAQKYVHSIFSSLVHSLLPKDTLLRTYSRNRQDSMTNKHETQITKRIHKISIALEQSVRKLLEVLIMFDGTNLTLIPDVEEDK